MRFGVGAIAVVSRRTIALCLCSASIVVTIPFAPVFAVGTNVHAKVDSGTLNPSLELTGITSPVVVETMPLTLSGNLDSLTQIQVFVDDVFSVTIPLDQGATTFNYNLVVASGIHAVKLVGVSPFADISPTVTVSVTYSPPQTNPGGSTSQPTTTSQQGGGVVISHDANPNNTTTYVAPTYASSLPGWFYNGLLALDIARPNDTEGKELTKTAQRIVTASTGLFFLAFARPSLTAYRKIRYGWLKLNKRSFPQGMRSHPLGFVRLVGALLISSVFLFI